MAWEACLCAAVPAMPAPAMPAPMPAMPAPMPSAPMAPAVANGPAVPGGAPGVVYRPLAEIVHDFRPTDVGDRFLWISSPHGNAQLHCGEHAIEAARRAVRGFDSEAFVCPDTRCFYAHEGGISDPTLVGERVGTGVRLIAYWNAYAGDASDERIAQFFAELSCGEVATFPAE